MKVINLLPRFLQKVVGIGFFFIWFEIRFFNFATNKANCDWSTIILKRAHLHQNKTINTLIVSALRSQQVQMKLEDSKNITYGVLNNIFQILNTQNVSVTQVIPCLNILSKKSESNTVYIVKKSTVNSLDSIHFQFCFKYIKSNLNLLKSQ